jgi:SHS2 domain-containing protein
MPYRFVDNIAIADVAFEATGKNLEELFCAAWDATLVTMISDPNRVARSTSKTVRLEHARIDQVLHDLLEELLYFKDSEDLLLRPARITVQELEGMYRLEAALSGEKIDSRKHNFLVDVKAVTYHRLRVEKARVGWRATVVLDV